jgi:DNA-binding beta-propeller fold protein YncE
VWLDLDLVKKGFAAGSLSLSHERILLLDTNTNTLVLINLSSKSPQILAGSEKLGETKLASLNGNIAWVFSKNKGVIKIDTLEGTVSTVIKPDDEWGSISDIYGFAGNVYLLDSKNNQIWKYLPIVAGFSDKRAYFNKETKTNLEGGLRLQIDSSIWILKETSQVLKYTQGLADSFSFINLDKDIKDPQSFYVSDQTENLYLLDHGNNRLLVFDKKGNYRYQYSSDRFSNFSDLVVDEKGKKIYLLEKGKIFQLDLH